MPSYLSVALIHDNSYKHILILSYGGRYILQNLIPMPFEVILFFCSINCNIYTLLTWSTLFVAKEVR